MSSPVACLDASIVLDRPYATFWGPEDKVAGKVVVNIAKSSDAISANDLFGPLLVKIILRGRTVQTYTSGNFKYREQRGLFTIPIIIHDGPYRFVPGTKASFPFSFTFPTTTTLTTADKFELSGYQYKSDGDLPLPPSFELWARALKLTTEYRLGVSGSMPGINISFKGRLSAEGHLLQYDASRPESADISRKTRDWQETITLPSWQLLPATERPNIMRRVRTSISSRQRPADFTFDIITTVPLDLYNGEQIPVLFKLTNIPNDTDDLPKITMSSPTVKIWGETKAAFSQTLIRSKRLNYNMSSFDLEKTLKCFSPHLTSDFASTSFKKTIKTQRLDIHPTSFDTGVLSREYTLQIEFAIRVVDKDVKLKRSFAVKIYPPPKVDAAAAQQSRRDVSMFREEQAGVPLPLYEQSTLPEYHEAPTATVISA